MLSILFFISPFSSPAGRISSYNIKTHKKQEMIRKVGRLLCSMVGLSRVTVVGFMQISPLAGDKNDYFIFLLTLQLSSSQCCIITTYSLFVSRDTQCDTVSRVT